MKRGSPVMSSNSRVVDLDAVERRQPQPRQVGDMLQDALDQLAERRRAGQIGAVAGDVDPGQHDLAKPSSTSALIRSTTSPAGTERLFPRP